MKISFKLLAIFLLIFIIFSFSSSFVFADEGNNTVSNNYTTDTVNYLKTWQDNMQSSAFAKLLSFLGDTSYSDLEDGDFKDLISYICDSGYTPYVVAQNNLYYLFLYNVNSFYSYTSSYEGYVDISYKADGSVLIPTVLNPLDSRIVYRFSAYVRPKRITEGVPSTSIPNSLMFYNSEACNNFKDAINSNSLSSVTKAIEENNKLQEETSETLKDANDFLQQDLDTENSNINLDFDTSENPYNSDISSIFNVFKNGFSSTKDFSIDFMGNTFTIPANYVADNAPSSIVTLISAFWWFVVCVIIYKEVTGIFDKLTTGDIEHISTDDPRVDLF